MSEGKRGKVLFLDGKYEAALEVLLSAAEDGDAEAAFDYAYCHQFGYGVEKDPRCARSFYTFAKERIPEANYNLAVMYMHGEGVARDYRAAYEYMRDAAAGGIIEAQLYLGMAYTMGTMFEPDIIAISKIPYHTPVVRDPFSALDGDVPDGLLDEELRIRAIRLDPSSALECFHAAAMQNSVYTEELCSHGKYLYARCFVDGVGTDFNRQRAEDLMLVAAADGSKEALAFLEERAPYRLPELSDTDKLVEIRRIERLPARS